MTTAPVAEPEQLLWVRNLAGRPHVRWGRAAAFLLATVGINVASAAAVSWFADTPFLGGMAVAPAVCGMLAYLTIAIELQRQRVLTGQWRFRLGLSTCLLLMLIAGIFFGFVSNADRATQKRHAVNLRLKADLEAVIARGNAYVGSPDGRRITCQITRPNFGDEDLERVIELASQAAGRCQISTLIVEQTQVTDAGLEQLAACQELRLLALPLRALSDQAIAAIAQCQRLEHLMLDEQKLTGEQLVTLKQALPRVRLNGKTWQERGL